MDPIRPGSLRLPDGEVHVWRAVISSRLEDLAELRSVLSRDERARADRFRAVADRARFAVARGALRRILARYTGESPESLCFDYGPWGKPRLVPSDRTVHIEFNLSHSGEMALFAFAQGRRLGVDVERIVRVENDDERLSRSWLSEHELAEMSAMDSSARTRRFYSLWTGKEAYLKARGEGLSLAPDRIRFPHDSVGESFESAFEPDVGSRWSLRELDVGPGYAAALAVEGHEWRISHRDYR